MDAIERQLAADQASARAYLQAAQAIEQLATERAALSTQAQALIAKAYQLGEKDLPTRLRSDNERFEAELALLRARIQQQRAIGRLHQSLGRLP